MILSFGRPVFREATTDDRNTERPPSTRQSTNVLLPLEICVLGLRDPIPYVGQHERQEEDATRRPNYALWYRAQTDPETNLVIAEAKTADEIGKGERQMLVYMGLVRAGRKAHIPWDRITRMLDPTGSNARR
ncbi:hypothetical protein PENDEC_c025G02640 [Penicillium decumbens]|uniref:Uncharacterized protein n=1 Tax=Penicillium decumbens TaxID=69771 RepID=A0A1V6P0C6_PENDC|nr:hypothetical protein PENDEC_c025G02640 [Penicillium decumbens]